jgi:hypothetical protein
MPKSICWWHARVTRGPHVIMTLSQLEGRIVEWEHCSRAVFARSKTGIVSSKPAQGMDGQFCVYVCVFLCLCASRGLATSWSPAQGVYRKTKI